VRFIKVFVGLFSLSAGAAIAGAILASSNSPLLYSLPSYRSFNATADMLSYQPPSGTSGVLGVIGDFIWVVGRIMEWIKDSPTILRDIMAAFGVPAIVADVVLVGVYISMAFFVFYLVSGRVFTTS